MVVQGVSFLFLEFNTIFFNLRGAGLDDGQSMTLINQVCPVLPSVEMQALNW